MRSHVFAVPILDRWLLHAPLHDVSALVNRAAIDVLQDDAGGLPAAEPELLELRDLLCAPPPSTPSPQTGRINPDFLGLIPTRGCNIGCVYCNFGGPTAEMTKIDPRVAVAAIDWMADTLVREGRHVFRLHFFGGEPFVANDIVDIVVHRTRAVCAQKGLVPFFDASTNGIFNESRAEFIGDYFDSVVLSFDGFRQHHDRNRPGYHGQSTFDAVAETAKRLRDKPIELCLRVCITDESVADLEATTRWMCEEFRPTIINFETLTPGELPSKAGLHVPDPYEFTRQCIKAYRTGRELGVRVVYSAAEFEKKRISFCPVGSDSPIVMLDGTASACYLLPEDKAARGLDLDFAEFLPDGRVQINEDALLRTRQLPLDKPRCDGCFCQWSCAGGCHVNHTYPGCSNEYDDFCLQTRLITASLLLEQMGMPELVDALLDDPAEMQRTATHEWDVIELREPAYA